MKLDRYVDAGTNGEDEAVLRSFWMPGFDGAGHLARVSAAQRVIDVAAYGRRVDADYATVRDAGIACVRETIDWRRVEEGTTHDLARVPDSACAQALRDAQARVDRLLRASRRHAS